MLRVHLHTSLPSFQFIMQEAAGELEGKCGIQIQKAGLEEESRKRRKLWSEIELNQRLNPEYRGYLTSKRFGEKKEER